MGVFFLNISSKKDLEILNFLNVGVGEGVVFSLY